MSIYLLIVFSGVASWGPHRLERHGGQGGPDVPSVSNN